MLDDRATSVPAKTGTLIDQIVTQYRAVHRTHLSSLASLAERVELLRSDESEVPRALASVVSRPAWQTEDHMAKAEMSSFRAIRAGGGSGIGNPAVTRDLSPHAHTCGSCRALYAGSAALPKELAGHIALENDVLFPRFEATR